MFLASWPFAHCNCHYKQPTCTNSISTGQLRSALVKEQTALAPTATDLVARALGVDRSPIPIAGIASHSLIRTSIVRTADQSPAHLIGRKGRRRSWLTIWRSSTHFARPYRQAQARNAVRSSLFFELSLSMVALPCLVTRLVLPFSVFGLF